MTRHHLDKAEARQIAVRAQQLEAARPADLVSMVEKLTLLQIDPTAAVAPSADLVAWSRLGSKYRPEDLRRALEEDRTLYEHSALIRPMSDLELYLADMSVWPPWERTQNWLEINDRFRLDILDVLSESGPLLSKDIPDTSQESWTSTGWTNARNVTQMLQCLMMRGEVAVAGRKGRQRLWDLAERVYPVNIEPIAAAEAEQRQNTRRLQALGIARATGTAQPTEPYTVGDAGESALIEGVEGKWRVDPDALDQPFQGRTALLSPFDRLVHDRQRAQEIFDFEFTLEMYKPKDQRRRGYFALPILHQDRLVGKLDSKADRKAGVFAINTIHEDVPFDETTTEAVHHEIQELAAWLGLEVEGL